MTTEGLALEAYTLSDQATVLHQKGILTGTYVLPSLNIALIKQTLNTVLSNYPQQYSKHYSKHYFNQYLKQYAKQCSISFPFSFL